MRIVAILSFFAIILFSTSTFAQLQYSVNAMVDEKGKSLVKLTITFPEPVKTFNFTIKGNVEKIATSSNAGSILCNLTNGLITFVNCDLNLTKEKRTIYIDYETKDFVKVSDKYYFDGDFSLSKAIETMAVSITLPENMVPSENTGSIFPQDAAASWDLSGRRLTITWSLSNLSSDRALRFQILYGRIQPPSEIWFILFLIAISLALVVFLIVKRMRKSKEVVLSVLDEFERKIMDVVIASGGTVNQRKVVQETNLSKAKVSRVVKSLAERGLIEVERLGRTNKLKAKKKIFE